MQNRYLSHIHHALSQEPNQKLFSIVSPIYALDTPPIPLTTDEMHLQSAEIIRSAKHEVLIMFYKFNPDSDGGRQIHHALIALKQKAEEMKSIVNVHIMVNSRGRISEYIYKENADLGLNDIISSEYFKFHVAEHKTLAFGSLHSKIIIIDSRVAMIRSGDPDKANNLDRHQFETATLIQGSVVNDMRHDFNTLWHQYTNTTIAPLIQEPTVSKRVVSSRIPCFFISKQENGNPLYTGGATSPYKISLLTALKLASSKIHIMTPNLNDTDICLALADACNNGVTVKLIIGKYHNDHSEYLWGGINRDAIADILNHVHHNHLDKISIRYAATPYGNIVNHDDEYTMHAKYICIDDQLVFVGSSPLDVQAMNYSREADLLFEDQHTAQLFDDKFFKEKYISAVDHFKDAYESLFIALEHQAKRIHTSIESDLCIKKAEYLKIILESLSKSQEDSLAKINLLIQKSLPILAIPTGNKPGKPYSYNAICQSIMKLGLKSILNVTDLQHVETTNASLAKKSLITDSPYTFEFSKKQTHSLRRTKSETNVTRKADSQHHEKITLRRSH